MKPNSHHQRFPMINRLSLVTALLCLSVAVHAQSVTEAQAREAAVKAAAAGEPKFHNAFRDEIRKLVPDYSFENVTLIRNEWNDVWIMGPVARYQQTAGAAVRKMEPLAKVAYPEGAVITVYPKRMDALNIEKVVVSRAGAIVEPIAGGFVPVELSNALGAKVSLGAGLAIYPVSAFAPGAEVVVTIVPATGSNIVKTLRDGDLKKIR
jgi:hypothetical protein